MFEVCRWKRKGISIDDDNNAMTFFLTRNSSHHHHNHCGCRFIFATIVAGGESSNRSNDNHFISLGHGNHFANLLLLLFLIINCRGGLRNVLVYCGRMQNNFYYVNFLSVSRSCLFSKQHIITIIPLRHYSGHGCVIIHFIPRTKSSSTTATLNVSEIHFRI